jgi:hypothetical protein
MKMFSIRVAMWSLFILSPNVFAGYTLTYSTNGTVITLSGYTGTPVNVTIPNFVSRIGASAFSNCTNLATVAIPSSVTNIATEAFQSCPSLNSLTFPSDVTIGANVIDGSSGVTNVTFLGSAYIAANAFYFSALASVNIPAGSIGDWAFAYCFSMTNVTLGSGITNIGAVAFLGAHVSNIVIPKGVTNIQESVFAGCTALTNVTIPYGVVTIGDSAFNSDPLASLTLPGSVTSIGDQTFEGASFSDIVLPVSVKFLGAAAFVECSGLKNVLCLGNAPAYGVGGDGNVFEGDPATVYYLPNTMGWGSTYDYSPTALWNPSIQTSGAKILNGHFGFNITGTPNIPIEVQSATNLTNGGWAPIQSFILTNGLIYFSDPMEPNYAGRFYSLAFP